MFEEEFNDINRYKRNNFKWFLLISTINFVFIIYVIYMVITKTVTNSPIISLVITEIVDNIILILILKANSVFAKQY